MNMDLESIAQSLAGAKTTPVANPYEGLKGFLKTPNGQAAARAALESIIMDESRQPSPVPMYKRLLDTLNQMQLGEQSV